MRTLAILLGIALFAGLVVMAVAGMPGARALLATGLGIVAIIVLGVQMGGRGSSHRRQRFEGDPPADQEPDPAAGHQVEPAARQQPDPVAEPEPDPVEPEPGAGGR